MAGPEVAVGSQLPDETRLSWAVLGPESESHFVSVGAVSHPETQPGTSYGRVP